MHDGQSKIIRLTAGNKAIPPEVVFAPGRGGAGRTRAVCGQLRRLAATDGYGAYDLIGDPNRALRILGRKPDDSSSMGLTRS